MTTAPRPSQAGVTLVEMLVALVLFTLVGLAAFTMLDTVIRARDRTEGRLEAVAAIDRALTLVSRDMAQSLPDGRSLRDGVLTVVGEEAGMALRLAYQVQDGVLLRLIGPDDQTTPLAQPVLAGVTDLRWRILDADGQWQEVWPPTGSAATAPGGAAAIDMQLTLTGEDGAPAGNLRRIVELVREPSR